MMIDYFNSVISINPGRKAKRSNSIRKKSEKEQHKLLAGGIFGVPLHVVLQIDAINGNRADNIIKCIRDKKRKNKDGGAATPDNMTPRLVKRFNSLKARSISPINLSPRYRSATLEDDYGSLKVPTHNDNHLMSRSFSTPATPLDSRKLRPVSSTSAIYNRETPIISLNDLVSKLGAVGSNQGSSTSIAGEVDSGTLEVPRLLQNCCQYILQYGLDQQGIFRVCGAKKQIRTLRAEFNTTSNMALVEETSVHVVAGLVKEFLKELPESLLTKTLYYPFLHCKRLENTEVRLEAYKELIRLLPRTNRDTLQYLLQFCRIVADHSQDNTDKDGLPIDGNLMDTSNLAVVFGPNILHRRRLGHGTESKATLSTEAWEAPQVIEVIQELVENHETLFTVGSDIRKEVLHMMHDLKQTHFDTVMNEYSGLDEDVRSQNQSPDLSADSKEEQPKTRAPKRAHSADDRQLKRYRQTDTPRRDVRFELDKIETGKGKTKSRQTDTDVKFSLPKITLNCSGSEISYDEVVEDEVFEAHEESLFMQKGYISPTAEWRPTPGITQVWWAQQQDLFSQPYEYQTQSPSRSQIRQPREGNSEPTLSRENTLTRESREASKSRISLFLGSLMQRSSSFSNDMSDSFSRMKVGEKLQRSKILARSMILRRSDSVIDIVSNVDLGDTLISKSNVDLRDTLDRISIRSENTIFSRHSRSSAPRSSTYRARNPPTMDVTILG